MNTLSIIRTFILLASIFDAEEDVIFIQILRNFLPLLKINGPHIQTLPHASTYCRLLIVPLVDGPISPKVVGELILKYLVLIVRLKLFKAPEVSHGEFLHVGAIEQSSMLYLAFDDDSTA
jgi:hypothetical protein